MNYTIDESLRAELIERIQRLSKPMSPTPTEVKPALAPLPHIKAVLFDIYGTMLTAGLGEVGTEAAEENAVEQALEAAGFVCSSADTGARGAALLKQFIAEDHQRTRATGVDFPEVDIRDIWENVVCTLSDEGQALGDVTPASVMRLAAEYEGRVNPAGPMPGLKATLDALHDAGLALGIVSNAQFYTPLLLESIAETGWNAGVFDRELCAWSYMLRAAKPSTLLLEHLLKNGLARKGIDPSQVLCVGNDLKNDILPAGKLGFQTALFAGDKKSLRVSKDDPLTAGIRPDVIVTELAQLSGIVLHP